MTSIFLYKIRIESQFAGSIVFYEISSIHMVFGDIDMEGQEDEMILSKGK